MRVLITGGGGFVGSHLAEAFLARGDEVFVLDNGSVAKVQTRCFTYIDDAVRATVAAGVLPDTDGEVFNIGTAVESTILELAEYTIAVTGSRSRIEFVPQAAVYGDSYEDIARRVPDVAKMEQVLGVRADTPLVEGLRRTVAWFQGAAAVRPGPQSVAARELL